MQFTQTNHNRGDVNNVGVKPTTVPSAPGAAPKERHEAIVPVTGALMADILKFPQGTEIIDITCDFHRDLFLIHVSNPDLPVVAEGASPEHISPQYTSVRTPVFVGWNIPTPAADSPHVVGRAYVI